MEFAIDKREILAISENANIVWNIDKKESGNFIVTLADNLAKFEATGVGRFYSKTIPIKGIGGCIFSIDARRLNSVLKELDTERPIFVLSDGVLKIVGGKGETSCICITGICITAENKISTPTIYCDNGFKIKSFLFGKMIEDMLAIDTNRNMAFSHICCFYGDENKIGMVSTDGYVLLKSECPVLGFNGRYYLPKKYLKVVKKIFGLKTRFNIVFDIEKYFIVTFCDEQFGFELGECDFFPEWEPFFGKEKADAEFIFDKEIFTASIKSALVFSNYGVFTFCGNYLHVSSSSENGEYARDIQFSGPSQKMSFKIDLNKILPIFNRIVGNNVCLSNFDFYVKFSDMSKKFEAVVRTEK
jgi:hypothetical protein